MAESSRKGVAEALGTVVILSGFILVSRLAGKSDLLFFDVVALRFGVAAVLLMPFWLLRNKVNLLQPKMIVLGCTGGLGYAVLAYLGFSYAPAAHAAILLPGMLPFEVAVLSRMMLGERPSARRKAGLCAIAMGVVSLAAEAFAGEAATWKGDIAFVGASSLWALYTVLLRKWKVGVWDAMISCVLVTAFLYMPVYLLLLPKHIMIASWHMIAIQAFYQGFMAVIVAMILYLRAVEALGPSKVGVFMALVPGISGIAAIPLLHEPLTIFVALGIVFTSFGAWLGSRG
jgi:drug/metabolite transporter (DMT)-like permease